MKFLDDNAVYVVGDVHACAESLYELVRQLLLQHIGKKRVVLYFVGDLIDRGPDFMGIYSLLSAFKDTPELCIGGICWGNHEEKFYRYLQHRKRELVGGPANPIKYYYSEEMINVLGDELLSGYFAGTKLTTWIDVPESQYIIIHGGILPLASLPPQEIQKCLKYDKHILRLRYVSPFGLMVRLGKETSNDKWWAEVYNGRFGTIIYGHQVFEEVISHKYAIGIDTGCVFGGQLSAIRLLSNSWYTINVNGEKR